MFFFCHPLVGRPCYFVQVPLDPGISTLPLDVFTILPIASYKENGYDHVNIKIRHFTLDVLLDILYQLLATSVVYLWIPPMDCLSALKMNRLLDLVPADTFLQRTIQ